MSQKFLYQFDSFRLDPSKQILVRDEKLVALSAKPFQLLLTLIESAGQTVSKEDLISRVWPGLIVSDTNFHVNLDKIRKALGESGRDPHYLIRTSDGYLFNADVVRVELGDKTEPREDEISSRAPEASIAFPRWHVAVSLALYSALYAESFVLEIAYEWANHVGLAVNWTFPIFAWMFATSLGALVISWRYAHRGVRVALIIPIAIFVLAVLLLHFFLSLILPDVPITQATFQTRSAQAAYLKDISYFLPLGIMFIVIPFHFVATARRRVGEGEGQSLFDFLNRNREAVPPNGSVYIPPLVLGILLSGAAVFSLVATNYLLDNLNPGSYNNLFTHLVMWRILLYFALGLQCLLWYYRTLGHIKNDCRVNDES